MKKYVLYCAVVLGFMLSTYAAEDYPRMCTHRTCSADAVPGYSVYDMKRPLRRQFDSGSAFEEDTSELEDMGPDQIL